MNENLPEVSSRLLKNSIISDDILERTSGRSDPDLIASPAGPYDYAYL